MKNIAKVAAVGLLSLNFMFPASAQENKALSSAGLRSEAVSIPEVSAPAAAAGQAALPDIFRCFGYGDTAATSMKAVKYELKGIEKGAAASINLESIKNAYLKPDVFFTTGAGKKVYVSTYKASNCPNGGGSCATKDRIFLVLTTENNESYFVPAMAILNWGILMHGSRTVTIDGEAYVVKAYANVSSPESSKLEIKGPRGVALSSTLQKVADAVAQKSTDVQLSLPYKLAYGSEIVQGPEGARFGPKLMVLLIQFPVVERGSSYTFSVSEINSAGVSFPSFETGYGFRLAGGALEIYKQ